jgi:hypothetical protein
LMISMNKLECFGKFFLPKPDILGEFNNPTYL